MSLLSRRILPLTVVPLLSSFLVASCSDRPVEEGAEDPDCARPLLAGLVLSECGHEERFVLRYAAIPQDADGPLNGEVREIGWNERWIWARRDATDPWSDDGWMIVDTWRHLVYGPFADDAFRLRLRELCACNEIEIHPADDAFSSLR